ncbi:MAG: hypothetical protein ACLPSH_13770 [Vulcanimicrobiaceae bacterium]
MGTIPKNLSLEITGKPAEPDFLESRIEAALNEAIGPTLQPGLKMTVGPILPSLQPLAAGFLRTVSVPVELVEASGSVALAGRTDVTLTNVDAWAFEPPVLFFDDDPEKIVSDGVLFRGTVDTTRPVRLYYYHEDAGTPHGVVVALWARSAPARVQIIQSESGPNVDVMSVGHAASRDFLIVQSKGEGIVTKVEAGKLYAVRDSLVPVSQVVAGVVDLHVLSGGPLDVLAIALQPGADPAQYVEAAVLPDDGHHRHGKFDVGGYGDATIAYSAGGPDASYTYGGSDSTPLSVATYGGRDRGDYGVLHQLTFDLSNPTSSAATLYLYEKPHGAAVRSSFLVDGNLKEIDCVRVPQRYEIASYVVPPGASVTISVATMTDGGSSYPLEIGISATPPVAQPPPQSAPDGCFPKPAPSGSPPAANAR